ncbi:hypothetical protein [Litoreibacter janthinus]|uniref:Uncharacterized protein n=1 Tax=Litoreibacter janthinus TaxID=670154 RepID=A0A1I6GEP0_9RHOB|nr:hypothetical protein [Litoreibacter janthinus]SFR40675.1 hypothetical protein SAMN04488002_1356 [Litoreibacter janthinus]
MLKRAFLASLLAATPLQALTLTEMSDSIEACHLPHAEVDATVDALAAQGWVPVPQGDLAPEIIELLIWPQVAFYATGDTGGEQIKAIVELQRKTVAGFAKKKDIPQSKTRILTRQIGTDVEAALVFWLQPDPAQTNIICRFALSSTSLIGHTAGGFAAPQVVDQSDATATKSFSVTVMNAGHLANQIAAPVNVSGVVETQTSFATGGN